MGYCCEEPDHVVSQKNAEDFRTLEKKVVVKCKQNLMGPSIRSLEDSRAESNSGSRGFMGFRERQKLAVRQAGSIGKTTTLKML